MYPAKELRMAAAVVLVVAVDFGRAKLLCPL
jgi:hypothetical protein